MARIVEETSKGTNSGVGLGVSTKGANSRVGLGVSKRRE